MEGGSLSTKQALLDTGQVHTVLEELDKNGPDVSCPLDNSFLDIWDMFCAPCLSSDRSGGNTSCSTAGRHTAALQHSQAPNLWTRLIHK